MNDSGEKPAQSKGLYIATAIFGLLSGYLIYHRALSPYHDGTESVIGYFALIAIPMLLSIVSSIFKPGSIKFALKLNLIYLICGAPFLGEGLICMIVILPVFLVVSALTVVITTAIFKRCGWSRTPMAMLLICVPPTLIEFENNYLRPEQMPVTISDSFVTDMDQTELWNLIEKTDFQFNEESTPFLVKLLMPMPKRVIGLGANVGDQRIISFSNGELIGKIVDSNAPHTFTFQLHVTKSGREFFNNWVEFTASKFTFESLPDGKTRVTHATTYLPRVYPRWYFSWFEETLASKTQSYMLRNFLEQHGVKTSSTLVARNPRAKL